MYSQAIHKAIILARYAARLDLQQQEGSDVQASINRWNAAQTDDTKKIEIIGGIVGFDNDEEMENDPIYQKIMAEKAKAKASLPNSFSHWSIHDSARICDACGQVGAQYLCGMCPKSSAPRFCDRNCQAAGWDRHKLVCKYELN